MPTTGLGSRERDPYQEAEAVTGGRYDPRVLEPWGPEAADDPFLAPDPVAAGVRGARPVLSPLGNGDLTWEALCESDPSLVGFCRSRWLAALAPLEAPPPRLAATVESLHLLAEHVVAPWRYAAQGRVGLRWTLGGFGTPWVTGDAQARVSDGSLVHQSRMGVREAAPATLGEAAAWLGGPLGAPAEVYTTERPGGAATTLDVDPAAAAWVGEWFGFATRVLEEVRIGEPDYDRRRVQLWPEHFDVAVDLGDGAARGTFGASPGDADHGAPYLYVAEWERGRLGGSDRRDPSFPGVSMPLAELLSASNHLDAAVAFLEHHRVLLGRT